MTISILNLLLIGFTFGTFFGVFFGVLLFFVFPPKSLYQSVFCEVPIEFEDNLLDIFNGKLEQKSRRGYCTVFRTYPHLVLREGGKMDFDHGRLYIKRIFNTPMMDKEEANRQLLSLRSEIERNDFAVLSSGIC